MSQVHLDEVQETFGAYFRVIAVSTLIGKLLTDIPQALAAEAPVGIVRLQICACANRQRNTDTLAQGIMRTHKRRSAPRTNLLNRLDRWYIHSTAFFATKIGKKFDIGKLSG